MEDEWSCSANEAVHISLVKSDNTIIDKISPTFTYPIFGDAETIFGYKELSIGISIAAHNGSPHVDISYGKKFSAVGSTKALDLNETLRDYLPEVAFSSRTEWQKSLQHDGSAWRPPGECVTKYSKKGEDFEIWSGSLLDQRVNAMVKNIQALVLFYIEAGTLLDLDEVDWSLDRWHVYFSFKVDHKETKGPQYSLLGYATTYRFYRFEKGSSRDESLPDPFSSTKVISPKSLPSRLRISQFLLLPPYQGKGHGSQMYRTIYKDCVTDETISELTVEDPSEEFDRLRDTCDWKILQPAFAAMNVKIDLSQASKLPKRIERVPNSHLLPTKELRTLRVKLKIPPRQFYRQLELYLLSLIPFSHRSASGKVNLTKLKIQKHNCKDEWDRAYYWWRVLVKQRIYRKNKDSLRDLEKEDQWEKLEDTARGQEDEYEGLLMLLALREAGEDPTENKDVTQGVKARTNNRKRKVVEEEEDDDSEVVDEIEVSMHKRQKD